jgi:hypothetical protein
MIADKYQGYSDAELKEIRQVMPKYLNDMTEDQKAISQAVYAEQKKRYDLKKEADTAGYNREVEKAGYKVGDKVSFFARAFIGFGGFTITGTVAKRKRYFVKLDRPFDGKKSANLTNQWRIKV